MLLKGVYFLPAVDPFVNKLTNHLRNALKFQTFVLPQKKPIIQALEGFSQLLAQMTKWKLKRRMMKYHQNLFLEEI